MVHILMYAFLNVWKVSFYISAKSKANPSCNLVETMKSISDCLSCDECESE